MTLGPPSVFLSPPRSLFPSAFASASARAFFPREVHLAGSSRERNAREMGILPSSIVINRINH